MKVIWNTELVMQQKGDDLVRLGVGKRSFTERMAGSFMYQATQKQSSLHLCFSLLASVAGSVGTKPAEQ